MFSKFSKRYKIIIILFIYLKAINLLPIIPQSATWQIDYNNPFNMSVPALIYDIDLFDTNASIVSELHKMGKIVLCYLDAGTWENWRPDASDFPNSVLGNNVTNWPGERWLDIRNLTVLGPIMTKRMQLCKSKGFDGIDADNVDGYDNPTGFNITFNDQITYNLFLSSTAHSLDLVISLKNDVNQVEQLVDHFDFSVCEQCFQYSQCNLLIPFINQSKGVFEIEYYLNTSTFCSKANQDKFMSAKKKLQLNSWIEPCWKINTYPPTILSSYYQHILPSSFNISITTDQEALCRYSYLSNQSYGIMNNNLKTENFLFHWSIINSTNNLVYIRCINMNGYMDTSDYLIQLNNTNILMISKWLYMIIILISL
jgi:hypothetical protein